MYHYAWQAPNVDSCPAPLRERSLQCAVPLQCSGPIGLLWSVSISKGISYFSVLSIGYVDEFGRQRGYIGPVTSWDYVCDSWPCHWDRKPLYCLSGRRVYGLDMHIIPSPNDIHALCWGKWVYIIGMTRLKWYWPKMTIHCDSKGSDE